MGNVTIGVTGDASIGTKSKAYPLSDESINRVVEMGRQFAIENGNPNPTTAQALVAFSDVTFERIKRATINSEREPPPEPPPLT
jgi:hypothetical protein